MNNLVLRGFSLIELIICVALIAVLSSLATTYYSKAGFKKSRWDAINSLQLLLQSQQNYFQINGQFTNELNEIDWYHVKRDNLLISLDQHYQLESASCQQDNSLNCIRLIATAASNTALKDELCFEFSMNSKGQFSASNRQGESNHLITQHCWK